MFLLQEPAMFENVLYNEFNSNDRVWIILLKNIALCEKYVTYFAHQNLLYVLFKQQRAVIILEPLVLMCRQAVEM